MLGIYAVKGVLMELTVKQSKITTTTATKKKKDLKTKTKILPTIQGLIIRVYGKTNKEVVRLAWKLHYPPSYSRSKVEGRK